MDNHNAVSEVTRAAANTTADNAIRSAAALAYEAGYSPKQAVMVQDDSSAVKQLFPANEPKQEAAYRYMMHDQHMQGYPAMQYTDLERLSDAETGKLDRLVDSYKPSVDVARVAREEAELARLGFPKVAHN